MRGVALLVGVLVVGGVVGWTAPRAIATGDDGLAYTGTAIRSQFQLLQSTLDTTSGALEIARLQLARAEALLVYSATYQIPSDLTALIYDTALQEGVDPELAFRLVNLESQFDAMAVSSAKALGLAQVQLPTARFYAPDISAEALFDPATNLRIGFRYLRDLLQVYDDTRLALLAYNRGPTRIKQLMAQGQDPGNGYASRIMQGYPR